MRTIIRWHKTPLATLAAIALSGCVVLPIPQDHTVGREVKVDPDKPIRIGVTTRADILAELGQPDAIWENERVIVYSWDHVGWAVAWLVGGAAGVVGGVGEIPTHRMLLVQFNENDRVVRLEPVERPSNKSYGDFLAEWAKGKADGKQ